MRVSTGCRSLDGLLGGGIEPGIITEIYGPAGTGKTSLCIQLCRGRNAAIIDTEGISPERIAQICGDNNNIQISRVTDFDQQLKAVLRVQEMDPEIVIVDSMVTLYRLVKNEDTFEESNQKLVEQLHLLSELAHTRTIPVVVTNQVWSPFKEEKVEPAGGDIMKYLPKCIIALETIGTGRRKAVLVKHRSLSQASCEFMITDKGIE